MSDAPESVLVLGATGTHGGAVARGLLAAGYQVRALVRDSSSSRAQALAAAGATLVTGDLLDVASLTPAFTEVDAVYAVTTPFENGTAGEERQGEAIIAAAETAGLGWLALASVASADKVSSVPHFASKWHIEQRLAAGSVPWTVIAPGYFYENVLGSMPAINGGAADRDPARQATRAGGAGEPGSARGNGARPTGRAPRSARRGRR